MGLNVDVSYAQTGSIYVEVATDVYRFADHADAYATAVYTCDDVEGTYLGALQRLLATGVANDIEATAEEHSLIAKMLKKASDYELSLLNEDCLQDQKKRSSGIAKLRAAIKRLSKKS